MNRIGSTRVSSLRVTDQMSLRRLEWATIVLPLAFVVTHHCLMIGPVHAFLHSWHGFAVLLAPLGLAVWAFSRAVFVAVRRMQAELEALHEQARALVVKRERQHIAREVHDWVAQVLTFVNTKVPAVELLLSRGDHPCLRSVQRAARIA